MARQVDINAQTRPSFHDDCPWSPLAITVIGFPGSKRHPADIIIVSYPANSARMPMRPVCPAKANVKANSCHAGNIRYMNIRGPHPGPIHVEPVSVMMGGPTPWIIIYPDGRSMPVVPIARSIWTPADIYRVRLPGPIVIPTVINPLPPPIWFHGIRILLHGLRQILGAHHTVLGQYPFSVCAPSIPFPVNGTDTCYNGFFLKFKAG